jgi:carbamoyl-phosphate synthase large subunit
MNILICSVGRRVKLVEYFKRELNKINGKIVAVDCDHTAAALYHADFFENVPRIDHPKYKNKIKELCKKYNITAVISLIDPELSLLSDVKAEFEKENISIIVSDKAVIDICYNKFQTYQFLQKNDLPLIPTYIDFVSVIEDINEGKLQFPLIVKPRNGSASLGIKKVFSLKELMHFENQLDHFIVQPFISGEEFGIDCYIDLLTKKTTNIFIKKKLSMRAGETDKSISVRDEELDVLIENLLQALKPLGPIDIDCFKTEDGYMISEINPRFGGGYLHAHEMGQNFVSNIINNLKGIPNEQNVGNYKEGIKLVKFDDFVIL